MTADARAFWDREAGSFDDEADHGLRDPVVRAAWTELLTGLLPVAPARVVDLGCGTGSLSVLLAEHGHELTGVDFSPAMIERAHAKATAAAVPVRFVVGEASDPELEAGHFDVVLARHVLWALPDPAAALRRWCGLLDGDDGRLVLVEGRWSTGAGLTALETLELVRSCDRRAEAIPLPDARLWSAPVDDERYVVVSPPSVLSR